MTLLLPTLAVAFAAFCVWLTVRISNRRERWAKWTLAGVVGVPVLYVASFGPACWIVSRSEAENPVLPAVYIPFGIAARESPTIRSAAIAYGRLWVQHDSHVAIPTDRDFYFGIIKRSD